MRRLTRDEGPPDRKVDATADRSASALNVHAVHQDVPFTRVLTAAIDDELQALARWLGLDRVRYG